MPSYPTSIRGDGLLKIHNALAALEEEPLRLQLARARFDKSPVHYASPPSGMTTRSPSPDIRTEEEKLLQERKAQLSIERERSKPYDQFRQQAFAERNRVIKAWEDGTGPLPSGTSFDQIAYDNIKKIWDEQGIWSYKWTRHACGLWKHEEPLELGSESETDSNPSTPIPLFGSASELKPRRKKSEDKIKRIADVRRREREASRPFHQFIYQMSKERDRLQRESAAGEETYTYDVNTRAYDNVQSRWRKYKIWNEKWGTMPGMSWKHELSWEETLIEHGLQSTAVDSQAQVSANVSQLKQEPQSRPSKVSKPKAVATSKKKQPSKQVLLASRTAPTNGSLAPSDPLVVDERPRRSSRALPAKADPITGVQEIPSKPQPKQATASGAQSKPSAKAQGISKRSVARNTMGEARKRMRVKKG